MSSFLVSEEAELYSVSTHSILIAWKTTTASEQSLPSARDGKVPVFYGYLRICSSHTRLLNSGILRVNTLT